MYKYKVQTFFLKKKSISISQAHQLFKEICTLKSPFFFQLFNFSSLDMGHAATSQNGEDSITMPLQSSRQLVPTKLCHIHGHAKQLNIWLAIYYFSS